MELQMDCYRDKYCRVDPTSKAKDLHKPSHQFYLSICTVCMSVCLYFHCRLACLPTYYLTYPLTVTSYKPTYLPTAGGGLGSVCHVCSCTKLWGEEEGEKREWEEEKERRRDGALSDFETDVSLGVLLGSENSIRPKPSGEPYTLTQEPFGLINLNWHTDTHTHKHSFRTNVRD